MLQLAYKITDIEKNRFSAFSHKTWYKLRKAERALQITDIGELDVNSENILFIKFNVHSSIWLCVIYNPFVSLFLTKYAISGYPYPH